MKIYYNKQLLSYADFVKKFELSDLVETHSDMNNDQFITALFSCESMLNAKKAELLTKLMGQPQKPEKPKEPLSYTMEHIPFGGAASSIWIDDNRTEEEQYQKVEKSPQQMEADTQAYQVALEEYKKNMETYTNAIKNPAYQELEQQAEQIKQLKDACFRAKQIPEWRDIFVKFKGILQEERIRRDGSKRKGLERLLNLANKINDQNDLEGPEKIEALVKDILQEYRHILRQGLTGFLELNSGSRLASSLRDFCSNNLGIQLPTNLTKGKELSINSVEKDESLYQLMVESPKLEMKSTLGNKN